MSASVGAEDNKIENELTGIAHSSFLPKASRCQLR